MDKAVLLVTLGTSDLAQDGMFLNRNMFRSRCSEIKSHYDKVKGSLSLPLLDPCLSKIKELLSDKKLDLVFLFYTRQEPPREDDTDIAAQVIKPLMQERWNIVSSSQIKLQHLNVSPVHYGEVLGFFHNFFERLDTSSWERCFLSITGGTPAMSAGLLFCGMMCLGSRAEVLYVPRGISEAFTLDTPTKLLSLMRRKEMISLCGRKNYAAALDVLRHTPSLPHFEEVKLLITIAHHRLLRDFELAFSKLNEAEPLIIKRFPPPQVYSSWRESLRQLIQTPPATKFLLAEVFYRSRIMLEQRDFVSFLSELFSLMDGVLGWQLERATKGKIPLNESDWERRRALKQWLQEHADIENWVRENAPDIDLNLGPNQKVTIALLKALSQLHSDLEERVLCQKLANLTQELEPLRNLRNKVTHHFEGASLEKIKSCYHPGPETALEKIKEALLELGTPIDADPYNEWNHWLEEWL